MHTCHLLLGSNLGNRVENISNALNFIGLQIGKLVSVSSVYETEPWGFLSDNLFLNQAVIVETMHTPQSILTRLQHIEQELGRVRLEGLGYKSRMIDIDILFFDDEVINNHSLTIPHPQLHNRRFVLAPLAEISKEKVHPVLKKSISQLLDECNDPLPVRIFANEVTKKSITTI